MSGEINVLSRTQVIHVDPTSGSVAIINAGPTGPTGAPPQTRITGDIECTGVTSPSTVHVTFPVDYDGKPVVNFWTTIPSDTMVDWDAQVRNWDEASDVYSGIFIRYKSDGTVTIHFAVEGDEV
jgi:hypothetical protein